MLFGFGYFVVMLFPVLGFFDQGFYQYSMVADHWQYYSIPGVTALAAAGAMSLGRRLHPGQQQDVGLAAGVVVIAFAVLSWQRCQVFQNPETLFRDTLLHNPLAWVAHDNLGSALETAGRTQEAIGHFEQELRIRPDVAETHYNLGLALEKAGRTQEAVDHYKQTLQISPDYPEAHVSLGNALLRAGKNQEAIGHFEQALRIRPD